MGSKQRKPRPPRPVRGRPEERARDAAGPGGGAVQDALRRGNQAAGADLIGRTLVEDPAVDGGPDRGGAFADPHREGAGLDAAAAAHDAGASSYAEIWAEVQDMIAHGAFSFRQLVAIIGDQPELSPEERVRMQEAARQQLRSGRGTGG